MKTRIMMMAVCIVCAIQCAWGQGDRKVVVDELAVPVKNGIWIQPAQGVEAQPLWGFADGIQIGLSPLKGPRGLLRIYTPYLGHNRFEVMNYIAFEPVNKATMKKGYSELEHSALDNRQGKRFWSGDTDVAPQNPNPLYPAKGVIAKESGLETLTVYFFCERFENGAEVYVKVKFTEGKPYEFEMTPYVAKGSVELDRINLTATMGNKARLRTLYLADGKTIDSGLLWPDYKDVNFTKRTFIPLSDLIRDNKGGVWFIATPNEEDPSSVEFPKEIKGWKYNGRKATQYWYCAEPGPDVQGAVNGRFTYWKNHKPIPGGIAYENFDMTEPLRSGQKFIFGISPVPVDEFIGNIPGYYCNPVVKTNFPDPTFLKADDGKFYAYVTQGKLGDVPIYRSDDMVNWEYVCNAFPDKKKRPHVIKDGSIWAPDVIKLGNRYAMVYSQSKWGEIHVNGLGVAVSDKPTGPFKDLGALFTSDEIGVLNSIDPSFYLTDDNRLYLLWGSFNGLYMIEMDPVKLKPKKGAEKVKVAGDAFEGSHIYRHGDKYYLFASIGRCCRGEDSTYMVVVGRGDSPTGPFYDKRGKDMGANGFAIVINGNDITRGPGHGSQIVTDANGDTWYLYHGYKKGRANEGRMGWLDRILWDEAGWPYVEGLSPSSTPKPAPVFK